MTITTAERFAAIEAQLATNSAVLGEIHAAVVGDRSPGSSLDARLTAQHSRLGSLESSRRWGMARELVMSAVTSLVTSVGLHTLVAR